MQYSNIFQQTKRKLDDVSKRLEGLYDMLRENRVSSPMNRNIQFSSQPSDGTFNSFHAFRFVSFLIS